ncbi:MAG: hypothetical protein ACTSQU_12050 [Promethearchaeota archaeon]
MRLKRWKNFIHLVANYAISLEEPDCSDGRKTRGAVHLRNRQASNEGIPSEILY